MNQSITKKHQLSLHVLKKSCKLILSSSQLVILINFPSNDKHQEELLSRCRFDVLCYSMNKRGKNTTLSDRLRLSDHSVKCHLQYLIRWSLGKDGAVLLFPSSRRNCAMFSGCELSDTWFDVLPKSRPTAVTGNTHGCHTDMPSL